MAFAGTSYTIGDEVGTNFEIIPRLTWVQIDQMAQTTPPAGH